jgi:Holliday junction resolvase-like predicted endonuclease
MTDNEATVTPRRALKGFVVVPNVGQREPLAVQRRRESRREEFAEQAKLATLLAEHLDPACTYWTALENKPLSRLSGFLQRRRGVKAGIPDVVVIFRQPSGSALIVFVELKSRRGVASEAQKQARAERLPAGAVWWMARSANAAMMALHLSGVPFSGRGSRRRSNPGRDRSPILISGCRKSRRSQQSVGQRCGLGGGVSAIAKGSGGGSISAIRPTIRAA